MSGVARQFTGLMVAYMSFTRVGAMNTNFPVGFRPVKSRMRSLTNLRALEDLGVVLKGSGGDAWDSWAIHNPTVQKVGDRYALFYMGADGSKLDIEQSDLPNLSDEAYAEYYTELVYSKRIGLALADSLDDPWERVVRDRSLMSVNQANGMMRS